MFISSKLIAIYGQNFKNKTAVIIGANAGLGFAKCEYLVQNGINRLVMGCRSLDKAHEAREKLLKQTPTSASVEVWQLDLSSLNSVKAFCDKWLAQPEEKQTIDVLFANAGLAAVNADQSTSEDGFEMTYQCNILSHFVIILSLLPALGLSSDPRVVMTGAWGGKLVTIPDPPSSNPRTPLRDKYSIGATTWNAALIYSDTKLVMAMMCTYIQDLLSAHPNAAYRKIFVAVYHPGLVKSTILAKSQYRAAWLFTAPLNLLFNTLAMSAERGVRPGLYLASAPSESLPRGCYWNEDGEVEHVSKQHADNELRRKYFERLMRDGRLDQNALA